jgi:hypothetical protein
VIYTVECQKNKPNYNGEEQTMATYPIEVFDAVNQNWRVFTYTTAPDKLDLFDTQPEAPVLIGTFDGRQVRLVSTSKADYTFQREHYRAQGYLAVDGKQWAEVVVSGPEFQAHPTYKVVREADVYPYACGDLQVDETLSRKVRTMARKQSKPAAVAAPVATTDTPQAPAASASAPAPTMKKQAVQSGRREGKAAAKAPAVRKTHQAVSGKVVDAPEVRPIRECSNCGKRFYGRDREGRCGVCFDFFKKNGKDRVHKHPTPEIIVGAPTLGQGHVRPPKQTAPVAAVIVEQAPDPMPAPVNKKRARRGNLETAGETLVVTEVQGDTLVVEPADTATATQAVVAEARKVELELITGGKMEVTMKAQDDLTTEQVQAIRRRFLAGETKAALAREFKRAPKTISDIVTYKSYKNVPRD